KQLYVSGFRGWQTNAAKESGFHRISYTGKKVALPKEMKVTKKGVYLTFTEKLDKELAEDIGSYSIKWWNYVWGPQYGSAHFSVNNPDKEAMAKALVSESKSGGTRGASVSAAAFKGDDVPVKSAKLLEDGKTVFLEIPNIRPVMQMEIALDLETEEGEVIISKIYNSIYKLAEDK
ncbi:MAG: cytochrome C, partial [Lentisphaeraceae bacterium]|nr:cytochrome C [Lentisphaeraceae bacterium]